MTRLVAGPAAVALAAALALASPQRAAAADDHADVLRKGAAAYAALERRDTEMLSRELDRLLGETDILELFRARRRGELLAAADREFAELKARHVTHWYFLEPEPSRVCFLRVHAPELHGDVVNRETFSQAVATKKLGAGKEVGKTAFALRVVKPARLRGELIGYMELGEDIDHFLGQLKRETGDDFGVLIDKRHVDRMELNRISKEDRWDDFREVVLVDSTMWEDRTVPLRIPLAELPDSGWMAGSWVDGGRRFAGAMFPLRDARRQVVGALFVRHAVPSA